MATCPSCGRDNGAHYRFCLGCGATLEEHRPGQQMAYRRRRLALGPAIGILALGFGLTVISVIVLAGSNGATIGGVPAPVGLGVGLLASIGSVVWIARIRRRHRAEDAA